MSEKATGQAASKQHQPEEDLQTRRGQTVALQRLLTEGRKNRCGACKRSKLTPSDELAILKEIATLHGLRKTAQATDWKGMSSEDLIGYLKEVVGEALPGVSITQS